MRDISDPRDWLRIWRDPPGLICCCTGTTAQNYHYVGGQISTGGGAKTNYLWNSAWTTKAAMSSNRLAMGAATPTTTSSAYFYGGGTTDISFFSTTLTSYTPDAWTSDTSMPTPARNGSASLAISGLCYSWGGITAVGLSETDTAQNDQLTPGSPSTWATKTAVTAALGFAAATLIGSKGYNFCGHKVVGGSLVNQTTNFEYTPSGDSWATKTAYPSTARTGLSAWTISSVAYAIDGGANLVPILESYTVDTWASQATPPTAEPTDAAQYHGGASIDASSVGWVTGGLNANSTVSSKHSEYTPNAWSTRTASTVALYYASGAIA